MDFGGIRGVLGEEAGSVLGHRCAAAAPGAFVFPGVDFVERTLAPAGRPLRTLAGLQRLLDQGRLAGTGGLCLLAATGGEAAAELALEGGCSALVGPVADFAPVARRYAHRLPFVAEAPAQAPGGFAVAAAAAGAVGVLLPEECGAASVAEAHAVGLVVLVAASGLPAIGSAAAAGADLVVLSAGLPAEGPPAIDAVRVALAASAGGRVGLLVGSGAAPIPQPAAVRGAVLQKRGGALGGLVRAAALPSGVDEAVAWLHAVQDVMRCGEVTVA